MEEIEYKPSVGEICVYLGNKQLIYNMYVECVKHYPDRSTVYIRGYETQSKYDDMTWGCETKHLSPILSTPDWEV